MAKCIDYMESNGDDIRKVAIELPEIINQRIETQEDLEKWKNEYESNLNLSKDSIKIAVLVNNHIHHEKVRVSSKIDNELTTRYFNKRLIHFYYYFCASKGEVCEPEDYYYESSEYSERECKKPEVYHKVKSINKNIAVYRCVKTKGWFLNNDENLEPFIKHNKYNIIAIYYEALNLLPKIYKRYRHEPHYESVDIDWCLELGWVRRMSLNDWFICDIEKRYEIKVERAYDVDGDVYHGRYKDVLIECGREFKSTDEMVVELPNENSTASNNEVKSEFIASGIFTGDCEREKEAIDLGHDYWIKKDDDNDYETYDTIATDNVIVPQKLANGYTFLKIVVNNRNEISSLIKNNLPVLDKLFKKA
jgi:hypothetical protein